MSRAESKIGDRHRGDGVDFGAKTGEQFQHFCFWSVVRHPKADFDDREVMSMIRQEFPFRTDKSKWPNKKRRVYQSIDQWRSYARKVPQPGNKCGIRTKQEARSILARIDAKVAGDLSQSNGDTKKLDQRKQQSVENGAGFGTSENNALVEKAAEDAVTRQYTCDGWEVKRVAAEKRGYDLSCRKGRRLEEVEVKGITGQKESFPITVREVSQAKTNKRFVLCVVTQARSASPNINRYSGREFLDQFKLAPLQFVARKALAQ